MIAAFAFKKKLPYNFFNLQILPLQLKITCVVLMAIECIFLLIALLLWIIFLELQAVEFYSNDLIVS